jgi:uncharacterized protein (DUF2147 family)
MNACAGRGQTGKGSSRKALVESRGFGEGKVKLRCEAALDDRESVMGVRLVLGFILLTAAAAPAAAQKLSPAGTWLSQTGDTRVRIAPCGGQMCGTIAWVKSPGKDVHNPDPAQRGRDLVGIRMITMSPSGAEQWKGTLYRYTDGQTFSGSMKMTGQNTMELSGCVAGGLICRSQTWTRAQ